MANIEPMSPFDASRKGWRHWRFWLVVLVWAVTALWCVSMVRGQLEIRSRVGRDVGWLIEAEALRREVATATASLGSGDASAFPELAARLAARPSLADRSPVEEPNETARWHEAAALMIDALKEIESEPDREALAKLAVADARLDLATSSLVGAVRRSTAAASAELGRVWWLLTLLSALLLLAGGGLGVAFLVVSRGRERTAALAERLAREERRYRDLVETANDLIWSVDAEGRFTFVNEASRRLYDYTPEEMLGRPFVEVLAPERREPDLAKFAQVLAGEEATQYETVLLHKDGHRVDMLFNARVIRDPEGRPIGATGTGADVTELKRLQGAAAQSQRLAALGTLAGGIAHDFNNILQAILLNAEQTPASGPARPGEAIREAAERGRRLVGQLLAFAQRQQIQAQTVDLAAAVEDLWEMLDRLLPSNLTLEKVSPDRPLFVHVDQTQLESVILNLVVNARDALAGRDRGLITVEVGATRADGGEGTGLSFVVLEVADDGVGMDEATRSRALEPFFTTKPAGEGSGMGLATVQGIVEQYDGRVEIDSAPGAGTRVRILLPEHPAPVHRQPATAGVKTLDDLRIALIEDQRIVREAIGRGLEASGVTVESFADATTAAASLIPRCHEVDVVLTDLVMPGVSGAELATELRAACPELPILFMSGYAEAHLPRSWRRDARSDLLAKPFTTKELLTAIAALIGRPIDGLR